MRPKAIVTFERLFLLSIVLSTVQLALLAGAQIGVVGPVTLMIVEAAVILLSVGLVLLVSRRRSNAARWVLVVLTAVGVVVTATSLGGRFETPEIVNLLATAIQAVAVAMLFTREARGWFAQKDVAAAE